MRKKLLIIALLFAFALTAASCGTKVQDKEEDDEMTNEQLPETEEEIQTPTQPEIFDDGLSLVSAAGSEVGTWWWDITLIKTAEGNRYLDFCAQNGVTDIYLSAYNRSVKGITDSDLAAFIRAAGQKSIRVSYLAGDATWINADSTGFSKITDDFSDYQEKALDSEKFYALHLDVEPHQLDSFSTDRAAVMQLFADFIINKAYAFVKPAAVPLYMDISFWLTDTVKDADGTEIILADLCAEYCDTITIMSYRDTSDKMLDVSKEEIEFAKARGCGIILGGECYSEEGDQVSYMEEGKAYMYGELKKVSEALAKTDGLSKYGVAIHNIKTWFALSAEQDSN